MSGAVSASVAQAAAEPDLAVTHARIEQAYSVVSPGGSMTPVTVRIPIRNVGTATAPASVTKVVLEQGGSEIASDHVDLGRLAPGHGAIQIVVFTGKRLRLGFVNAVVRANATHTVRGGKLGNDFDTTFRIPVIARRWDARQMEAEVTTVTPGLGLSEDDHATASGLFFQFRRLSHGRFLYSAQGPVNQTATFSGGGCSGSGSGSGSMSPWGADSGLSISRNLTEYLGVVRTSLASPFTVKVVCPGFPVPLTMTVRLLDLLTTVGRAGPLPMRPSAQELHDTGTLGSPFAVTHTWRLVADIP